MADKDPVVFDEQSAKLIAKAVKAELARYRNPRTGELVDAGLPTDLRWLPYINEASEDAPPYAVMRVSTGIHYSTGADAAIMRCSKPSTVFTRLYAINSPSGTTAGGSGFCTLVGPVRVLYDSTASASFGDGYGPQPGSWRLKKGFPLTTTVLGVIDSSTHILYGTLDPINRVIGKTVVAASTGSISGTTTVWKLMGGTLGSEVDAGFSTLPSWHTRTAISSGLWIELDFANNGWNGKPLECNP